MRTGSTLVRVLPRHDGGWDVREPGNARVLEHASQRDEAIRRAQSVMINGGTVQVLDRDGFLDQTYSVPSPNERPWWYVPPSPLYWVMGGLFLLQGILGISTLDPRQFRFWMGMVMAVMGALYLAMVLASRRRNDQLVEAKDSAR